MQHSHSFVAFYISFEDNGITFQIIEPLEVKINWIDVPLQTCRGPNDVEIRTVGTKHNSKCWLPKVIHTHDDLRPAMQ